MPLPKRPYSKRGDRRECVDHPLYRVWHGMMRRCYLESERCYKNYGGRGISVHADWHHFKNFLNDMGDRPDNTYTLERIDNNLGYFKSNCRWASRSEQCVNRRKFSNNTSGETGVFFSGFSWVARFDYEYTRYNIGRSATKEEAVDARANFIELFFRDRELAISKISKESVWRSSSTKIRGVSVHPDGGYLVRVTVKGVRHYVGYYKDLKEAENARNRFIEERTTRHQERVSTMANGD